MNHLLLWLYIDSIDLIHSETSISVVVSHIDRRFYSIFYSGNVFHWEVISFASIGSGWLDVIRRAKIVKPLLLQVFVLIYIIAACTQISICERAEWIRSALETLTVYISLWITAYTSTLNHVLCPLLCCQIHAFCLRPNLPLFICFISESVHESLSISEDFNLNDVEFNLCEITILQSDKDWIGIECVCNDSCVAEFNRSAVHIFMSL